MKIPIKIREFAPDDEHFILNSWLMSVKSMGIYRHVPGQIFFSYMEPKLKDEMVFSTCIIACNPDDENQIYGVLLYSDNQLVWAYTKAIYRRMGVYARLTEHTREMFKTYKYHCFNPAWKAISRKSAMVFNPFEEVLK